MSEHHSSYRNIVKATSIFGGVQVFSILVTIIRSKIVAVLLGPLGIGINSLLNSTVGLIAGFTSFGLGTSAVKSVSLACNNGDQHRISIVVSVLRRLVWITGLLGSILTILFSSHLSKLAFGNTDYTTAFIWIAVTLLLNQLSIGQTVILRGFRRIGDMARSSLSGSIIGLFISIPFYYFFGIDGIVPAIILSSISNLIRTWYFARKIQVQKVSVSRQLTFSEGKEMLFMGFMLSVSGLYVLVKDFGIRAYISSFAGISEVGLYSAGFAIVTTYVGLVFTAMGTDYFPRLSSVAEDNLAARKLINEQTEIGALILGPLLVGFIVFIDWIIVLLYSSDFIPINKMIQWAALGMLFKLVSWSNAYLFLAKGKSKMYLYNELFGGTVTLAFHLGGYYFGGLTGMGVGFLFGYVYYMFQVYFVSYHFFQFQFDKPLLIVLIPQIILNVFALTSVMISPGFWGYIIGTPLIVISVIFSYVGLDKRIDLRKTILKFMNF